MPTGVLRTEHGEKNPYPISDLIRSNLRGVYGIEIQFDIFHEYSLSLNFQYR